jgi:hypothetical protein
VDLGLPLALAAPLKVKKMLPEKASRRAFTAQPKVSLAIGHERQ